ncbi:MAG: amidohydrolase [Gammaproteobacteria bacterium]|nr:amidohydrolase [Gammaproteobacteria bacterium]MDH3506762.1 amidohydrolase [Gammaproteobacteria bacterium]
MLDRRSFLATGAYAAGGLLLASAGGAVLAQDRKIVRVGGRRVTVVDIHAHCDFPEVADVIRGTSMADANLSRVLGPERIADMDAWGIDVAALSVNRYWWYEADHERAREIVRINDEQLAAWCRRHPDRFVALSSPALQFPELAAEQLEYAVTELGHRGGSVGGHVQGEQPSLAKYDPFWAKAEELGVPVFMHPQGAPNIIQPGALAGPGGLGNVIGNPLETTLFLSRMIFDGTLDRFPTLKICAAHGGGFLPSYIGRSEVACDRNNARCVNTRNAGEYFTDQILVDSMVFNEEGIRHLVAVGGASQVVYGTDMPHGWPDTLELIVQSPSLTDAQKTAILGGNLVELLRIG